MLDEPENQNQMSKHLHIFFSQDIFGFSPINSHHPLLIPYSDNSWTFATLLVVDDVSVKLLLGDKVILHTFLLMRFLGPGGICKMTNKMVSSN